VTLRARALAAVIAVCSLGCAPKGQRAVIVAAQAEVRSSAVSPPRALDIRPKARRYVVDPTRSRFVLTGADIFTGEHEGTFTSWRASVTIEDRPILRAEVDTDSLQVDVPAAAGFLKRHYLETHLHPTATLVGTLSKTDGPQGEHVVAGTAFVHGVRRGIRFVGTLHEEGDDYRFAASFLVSRKEFDIRYSPLEPFVREDVRITIDVHATPVRED